MKKSEYIFAMALLIMLFLILAATSTNIARYIINDVDVNVQDYFGELQSYFLIRIEHNTTLAVNAQENSNNITVSNSTGCTANQNYAINIYDNESFYQGLITNINGNVLTITPILDKSFSTTNTFIECGRWNMNIDGSTTQQIFEIKPPTNVNWHIESNVVQCQDNTDWDSNKFCGITALTNGLIAGIKDGYHKHLWLIYNNAGFGLRGFIINDYEKAPAGIYGFSAKLLFEENYGAIIMLSGENKDSFRYGIRDDLTGITTLAVSVNGHKTTD